MALRQKEYIKSLAPITSNYTTLDLAKAEIERQMSQGVRNDRASPTTLNCFTEKAGRVCPGSGSGSQTSNTLLGNTVEMGETGPELSTSIATPPETNTPSTGKSPVPDSAGTDSGYASQSSSPGDKDSVVVESILKPRRLFPLSSRKTIKLKPINKPVPRLTWDRFSDLRELHADSLNKLTKGLPRCQGILMTLKLLGQDEDSASPWIFIQCDKAVSKNIKDFFKQPEIKRDFQPPDPDSFSPHFEIHICELPPKPLVKQNVSTGSPDVEIKIGKSEILIQLQEDERRDTLSLCGKAIKRRSTRVHPEATLGGLIKLDYPDGTSEILGMTAGHFLTPAEEECADEDSKQLEKDGGSDVADNSSESGQIFEIDLSFLVGATDVMNEDCLPCVSRPEPGCDEESVTITENAWCTMGSVHEVSQTTCNKLPNLDWALVRINDPSLYWPNIIMAQHVSTPKSPRFGDSERKVIIATGSSGDKSGFISTGWSYLMLSPGQVLTKAYLLTLEKNEALQTGDSGGWVADCETMEVYGHVVASDVFGGVYVVPMLDTFEDIKERLSALSISLPLPHEVFEAMRTSEFAYKSTQQALEAFEAVERTLFGKEDYHRGSVIRSLTPTSKSSTPFSRASSGLSATSLTMSPNSSYRSKHARGSDDEDEQDSSNKSKRSRSTTEAIISLESLNVRFACPFYKKSPGKYHRGTSLRFGPCQSPGWTQLRHLKDHLRYVHKLSQCGRCYEMFKDIHSLTHHRHAEQCEERASIYKEGIDDSQWRLIDSLIGLRRGLSPDERGQHDIDKWYEMWRIIFGDLQAPPNPYVPSVCETPPLSPAIENRMAECDNAINLEIQKGNLERGPQVPVYRRIARELLEGSLGIPDLGERLQCPSLRPEEREEQVACLSDDVDKNVSVLWENVEGVDNLDSLAHEVNSKTDTQGDT